MKRHLQNFIKPRRFFRLKAYIQAKDWTSFWVYLLVGYHPPFDLFIMPRIAEMEGWDLPDLVNLFRDCPMDISQEPTIPLEIIHEKTHPGIVRRFPRGRTRGRAEYAS